MNKLLKLSLFIAFIFALTTSVDAQKKMTEGSVTYELKLEDDNPMAGMVGDTKMEVTFKEDFMKTSINLMGGMMNMNMIMDNENSKGLVLMSAPMMGKNMAAEMTKEDIEKAKEDNKVNQAKPEIKYFKKKKKKIAGYKCYKAEATLEGMDEPITLYINNKINPTMQSQIQSQIPGLNGFPLSYEMVAQGQKIIFEAVEVSNKVPSQDEFDMTIPDGFEKVTLEELGGMGGMGSFGM